MRFERAMGSGPPSRTAWTLARRTVRCSSRWVWSSFRPGLGRDSTPAGGTGGVRPGGRGDRRRNGGNADHAARRSRRGLSREIGRPRRTVAGGRRQASGGLAAWGDVRTCGSGRNLQPRTLPERSFSGGIEGGRSHPRQSVRVQHGVGWLTDLKSVSQPSAEPPKPPPGSPPGTASAGPSPASSPAPWPPASKRPSAVPRRSCRPVGFRPTRTPRGPEIVDLGRSCDPHLPRTVRGPPGKRALSSSRRGPPIVA